MQGENPEAAGAEGVPRAIAETLRAALPEAREAALAVLPGGWDSLAVEVGGALVCKFPKTPEAEARLRREVAILTALAGRVTLPIPHMRLVEASRPFSVHTKLVGEQLLPAQYPALPEAAKARLAADLARFHAELHAIPAEVMTAAGAAPIAGWADPDAVLATALRLLPAPLHRAAEQVVRDWQALSADREVFGFFDGHGWNMAFDHAAGRLNGIYDFADSGLGPLHRDFVPAGFVALDLSRRLVAAYVALTGTPVDPDRVRVTTGMVRLWEVASVAGNPTAIPGMVANFAAWA